MGKRAGRYSTAKIEPATAKNHHSAHFSNRKPLAIHPPRGNHQLAAAAGNLILIDAQLSPRLSRHIEAGEIRLRDAKTGARSVALSPAARRVLAGIPRLPDNPWVISGARPGARLSNLNNAWLAVRVRADLKDVRIHDLRHSFASRALALGESLPMIGRMLGHRKVQTTARYAHLARDSVKASAARVAESLRADLAGETDPPCPAP